MASLPHVSAPYSGRIIVRLKPAVAARLAAEVTGPYVPASNRLLQLSTQFPDLLPGVEDALGGLPVRAHEVIAPFSVPEVVRLEARAAQSRFPPLHSLIGYFVVDPRATLDAVASAALLARLDQAPEVDIAYRESEVVPAGPPVTWADETAYPTGYLGHFAGNAIGINAVASTVWGTHDGSGIGFADIEGGWNLTHVDLPPMPPVFNTNSSLLSQHGTAVLGIVMGRDNATGIVGLAPGATLRKLASHLRPNVAPWDIDHWAITAAILETLSPGGLVAGDVLLIELQTVGDDLSRMWPIEVVPEWFDAIRLAVGNGVVVVEPAGNGTGGWDGRNLDDWNGEWDGQPTGRVLQSGSHASDSGAILVSGCEPVLNPSQQHERVEWLNYGSRVDCYAWGQGVYSTGYGSIRQGPGTKDYWYTDGFSETSAASAIIAGAALLVQEMHETAWGWRLSPSQLRSALRNQANGTPIVHPATTAPIGVMPDLAKVATQLATYPDVFVRDSVGDIGVVPSASVFQSPDIIVRRVASPAPQAEFGQGSPLADQVPANDPVTVGADNHLYVRIRNRSGLGATGVTAYLYWSEAGTLVAPIDWHLIGQIAGIAVPPGGVLTVAGPLVWNPAAGSLPASGHGCLVAVLDHALDPMPPSLPAAVGGNALGWSEFLSYVGASNNVAWRNITIVAPSEEAPATWPFRIRGSWEADRDFVLELESDIPDDAGLTLEVPPALAELLEASAPRGLPRPTGARGCATYALAGNARLAAAVQLPRDAEYRCVFRLDRPARTPTGGASVVLRQLWNRINVGQLTWRLPAPARRPDPRDGYDRR